MATTVQADLTLVDGQLEHGVVVHLDASGLIEGIERESETGEVHYSSANPKRHNLAMTMTGEFSPVGSRKVHRLRGKVLLPGFVNSHSHAFQRLLRGRTECRDPNLPDSDFWSWRQAMYRVTERLRPEDLEAVSEFAFMEMVRAGFTHVAEFHYLHHQVGGTAYEDPQELSRRVLSAAEYAGIGITLLPVAYQRGGLSEPLIPAQTAFVHEDPADYLALVEGLRSAADPDGRRPVVVGMAAHSVRALDKEYLSAMAGHAGAHPMHAHVAEQPREIEECLAEHGKRPMELLSDCGLLSHRFTAIHATHLGEGEAHLLGSAGAGACICPTTERNLGDGLPDLSALRDAGVSLSIGSDSQVRIDPFAEMRGLEDGERLRTGQRAVLRNQAHEVAPVQLEAASAGGGRSVGLPMGTIEVGQRADLVALTLEDPSMAGIGSAAQSEHAVLAALVLGGHPGMVRDVWIGGRHVVHDGEMLRWEPAYEAYVKAARRVWS